MDIPQIHPKELIAQLLPYLGPRERSVIESRYELNGEQKRTLQEIGNDLGVTKERIRQIEKEAIRTLAAVLDKAASSHHLQ